MAAKLEFRFFDQPPEVYAKAISKALAYAFENVEQEHAAEIALPLIEAGVMEAEIVDG